MLSGWLGLGDEPASNKHLTGGDIKPRVEKREIVISRKKEDISQRGPLAKQLKTHGGTQGWGLKKNEIVRS